jgi:long-chain acyl-CoA synthetase
LFVALGSGRSASSSSAIEGQRMTDPCLDTLPKLLLHNATRWPGRPAMREKEFGIWNVYTWADYRDRVREIALGLAALGVRRGEVVALLGRNRPNWVWSELAAQALGCMSLGIYEDVLPVEAGYLVGYAEAVAIFCEDEEQVDKILQLGTAASTLRWIVYHDDRGMRKYTDPRLVSWDEIVQLGRELDRVEPDRFEREVAAGRGSDVAILCTTSGTTSNPKLAMLQHEPFLRHIRAYLEVDPRGPDDEYVSILPLPWIMEQVYTVAMPLLCGIRTNFPESAETAMRDLREIGPTHILLAPRVWEQMAADVRARILDAGPLTRRLFEWAVRVGTAAAERGDRDRLADLFVFGALRDRLGFARLKSAATGGAALGPDTFKFFLAMGVPLRQLYGQTKLSGAYTLQVHDELDTDSSGVPFPDTEVRIEDPDENGVGEIVTRHAGMFKGYFKNEEATRDAFTPDGWMRTGDAGYFDAKGRLIVIDRVKDIARTSTGVRFSPQFIENKLKFSPYIGEAVVLGNRRPYVTAILCIRYSMVSKWAEMRRIGYTTYQNLATNRHVVDLLADEVEKVNAALPESQRIRRFVVLYKELDPDDGEVTRTRKVRRSVIDERYAEIIEAMYAGRDRVHVDTVVTFEDGRTGRIDADLEIRDTSSRTSFARAA